jgi:hypothetical protein
MEAQGRLMPGGENAIIVPPDPDRDRQEEILIEHITDWFGSKVPERDIIDCAGGAVDDLNLRRLTLLNPPELPPFVEDHLQRTG